MIWTDIIELLFPRYCIICNERLNKQESHICINCLRKLPYTNSHLTKENTIEKLFWYHLPIQRAASYLFYSSTGLREVIHSFKYYDNPYVGAYLARLMALEYNDVGFFKDIDIIVPVPLHWQRRLHRGYNQAYYIAKSISNVTGIPVITNAIKRIKNNTSQTRIEHQQRQSNVSSIFKVIHPELLRGKHILLVDDVITTGSTLISLGKTIAELNDARISIVSLCYAGNFFCNFVSENEDW